MKTIQILTNDNCEAFYIDGKKVAENDRINVQDLASILVPMDKVTIFDEFDYEDDDDFTIDDDGNTFYDGKVLWKNGEGFPDMWPFPEDFADEAL